MHCWESIHFTCSFWMVIREEFIPWKKLFKFLFLYFISSEIMRGRKRKICFIYLFTFLKNGTRPSSSKVATQIRNLMLNNTEVAYKFFCGNCSSYDPPPWRRFVCSLKKRYWLNYWHIVYYYRLCSNCFFFVIGVIVYPLCTKTLWRNDCLTPIHQYWVRSECH